MAVGALVFSSKNEILIVRPNKWRDKFSVPSGHIELGERAEDAIKREVIEETGLDVEPVKLLLVQEAIYPKDFHKHEHSVSLDYLCKTRNSRVRPDGRGLQAYPWVYPMEALKSDQEYTSNLFLKYIEEPKNRS